MWWDKWAFFLSCFSTVVVVLLCFLVLHGENKLELANRDSGEALQNEGRVASKVFFPDDNLNDPSRIWYQAYTYEERALDLESKGHLSLATQYLDQADTLYIRLQNDYSDFQPELVKFKSQQAKVKRISWRRSKH